MPVLSPLIPGFSSWMRQLHPQIAVTQPTPLFYAQRTIALKLANFQKIKKIKEKIRGKIILEGQYRFINDDRVIYVLWGRGRLPSEIKGKVKVADISGSEKVLTSGSIRLTSSPIFIEIIE